MKKYFFNKLSLLYFLIFIVGMLKGETSLSLLNELSSNEKYKKSFEIGENTLAIGKNAIATGVNSISIGLNSLATGGNETKETLDQKLRENFEKIEEINEKEKEVRFLKGEIEELKIKYNDVISAAIRVEEIMKAKENARLEWRKKEDEYISFEDASEEFFRIHNEKIRDLDSKLSGIRNITVADVNTPEGLENAALNFKNNVERETTLDLSVDFYKEYIVNYYKAIGEIRVNNLKNNGYLSILKYDKITNYKNSLFSEIYNDTYEDYDLFKNQIDERNIEILKEAIIDGSYIGLFIGENETQIFPANSSISDGNLKYEIHRDNYETYEYIKPENSKIYFPKIIDENLITINEDNYNKIMENVVLARKEFNDISETYKIPKYDMSEDEVNILRKVLKYELNRDLNYYEKQLKTAYYQYKYEETRDLLWLDKKANIENEQHSDITNEEYMKYINQLKLNEREYNYNSINKAFFGYLNKKNIELHKKWEKENIIEPLEKNDLIIRKLREELENVLGINKNAIEERKREIEEKKRESNQAYINYNAINPSAEDVILSLEYERVLAKLNSKTENLKIKKDRLEYLINNLTLDDLKIGENAISIGTNSIVSGNTGIGIGKENIVVGREALALGNKNIILGLKSIGIGNDNNILSDSTLGIGNYNSINGENTIILGNKNSFQGENSGIIGNFNEIYTGNSYIIGDNNRIGRNDDLSKNLFVFGSNISSVIGIDDGIVLGNNSEVVSRALSIGSSENLRKIVNVAEGEISPTSNEVITGKQLKKVIDSIGNTVNGISNNSPLDEEMLKDYVKYDNLGNSVRFLRRGKEVKLRDVADPVEDTDAVNKRYLHKINNETQKIALKGKNGVANAIAMTQLTQSSSFNEFNHSLSVGVGNYEGINAVALGFSGSSENRRFNYKLSGSVNNRGNIALGFGFGVNIGEKESINNEEQFPRNLIEKVHKLEKENEEIRGINKKLMEKIEKLEEIISKISKDYK